MSENRTVDIMKKKRKVPGEVREGMKNFNRIKKTILEVLREGPATIPGIAGKTGMSQHIVTYHLMTMMKYGVVEADRPDDMDEYYYYRVKEN